MIQAAKTFTVVLSFSLLLATAQAGLADIVLTSFDANSVGVNSDVGTFFNITTSPATGGNPTVYSFSGTGDLDGGTVNDTLSFDLTYTIYTGSTFDGTGSGSLGTSVALADLTNQHFMNNYVGDGNTNTVTAGDSFTATIGNISYTSGEGFTVPGVSFAGFNEISKFGGGTADVYLGPTGSITKTVGGSGSNISLDGVTSLTMMASANSDQRWRDLDFSFTVPTAVPEPSSAVLFAMGIATVALRRRRS